MGEAKRRLIEHARSILSRPIRSNGDALARLALGVAVVSANDEQFDEICEMIIQGRYAAAKVD